VYDGLHAVVGRRRISRFLSDLARPHVVGKDLRAGYAAMAADEARSARPGRGRRGWWPTLPTSRVGVAERASPPRGDVWLVAFDPSLGGEVRKTRPAVVLSNDTANAMLDRVQVVPISSSVDRLYPAEACITVNGRRRKAMADQITTASTLRLRRRMGRLVRDDVNAIARALRVQLDL
jgi:mRNA interferase MazF